MTPRAWAIVNLTPNSFSDGGELGSPRKLLQRLEYLLPHAAVFDFGAESTAPFNDPISYQEEIARFEQLLFPILDNQVFVNIAFSIDTYHLETFKAVATKIRQIWPNNTLIWNDVSSFLDREVSSLLNEFHADYVLCHNLAPTRALCSSHMEYTKSSNNICLELGAFFQQRLASVKDLVKGQIYLDPCFGFSKSYEQNWELLNNLEELYSQIPGQYWLIGISRKSFLKKKLAMQNIEATRGTLDLYHSHLLDSWKSRFQQYRWDVRLHAPEMLKISELCREE